MAQVYVDDIVFGATIDDWAIEFSEEMKKDFEMSMVGELTFFLGLQVKQKKEGIFVSQEKYARNIVKKFGLDSKKHASTPMRSSTKLNVDSSEWKWVQPCIGVSLGVYSILQLVDWILHSALVFVLDIKLLQRNHTWLQWSELYDTSMELQIMVCGIQKTQMLALPGIQMQTGLAVWTIERVLQEAASTLVTILSRGWARNKIQCLSLQLKQNT